jgi:hypothetical protein
VPLPCWSAPAVDETTRACPSRLACIIGNNAHGLSAPNMAVCNSSLAVYGNDDDIGDDNDDDIDEILADESFLEIMTGLTLRYPSDPGHAEPGQHCPQHACDHAMQSSAPAQPAPLAATLSMNGTTPHPQQQPDAAAPREVIANLAKPSYVPPAPSAAATSMLVLNRDRAVQDAVESLSAGLYNPSLLRLWELLASHRTPLTTRAELEETLALLHTERPLAERGYTVLLLNGGAKGTPFKPTFMEFGGPASGNVAVVEGRKQLLKQSGNWANTQFSTPVERHKLVKLVRAAGSQVGSWIRLHVQYHYTTSSSWAEVAVA